MHENEIQKKQYGFTELLDFVMSNDNFAVSAMWAALILNICSAIFYLIVYGGMAAPIYPNIIGIVVMLIVFWHRHSIGSPIGLNKIRVYGTIAGWMFLAAVFVVLIWTIKAINGIFQVLL